jgi:hypothetical protein
MVLLGLATLAPTAGALTQRASTGTHVEDAKFGISFYLPPDWSHATITTTATGLTKVEVLDKQISGTVGLVQVEVLAGRHISAPEIAQGLLSSPGTAVTGSKLVRFPIGEAEELSFTLVQKGDPEVYGTMEGFYRGGRSYYVAFDSPYRSVNNAVLKVVMATWGH